MLLEGLVMASEEKFDFYINDDFDRDYHGDEVVEIAKIVDVISSKEVLYLFYDKNTYANTNFHLAAGLVDENGIPCVMIDDEHKGCLYDKPEVFFAILLHELGHYRNGDLERLSETKNTSSNLNYRTQNILNGKVQDEELNADAFAVKHIGNNKGDRRK